MTQDIYVKLETILVVLCFLLWKVLFKILKFEHQCYSEALDLYKDFLKMHFEKSKTKTIYLELTFMHTYTITELDIIYL